MPIKNNWTDPIVRIKWMPTRYTFEITPLREYLIRIIRQKGGKWIDPFVGRSPIKHLCYKTNDLATEANGHVIEADYHLDALKFFKLFENASLEGVILDPPYSPRQVKECYESVGKKVLQTDTQSTFWSALRDETARVLKPGGTAITFGYNTTGIGSTRGFDIRKIIMIAHSGQHNDTLVTISKKTRKQLTEF